jgi:hypothetical protein
MERQNLADIKLDWERQTFNVVGQTADEFKQLPFGGVHWVGNTRYFKVLVVLV